MARTGGTTASVWRLSLYDARCRVLLGYVCTSSLRPYRFVLLLDAPKWDHDAVLF